MQALLLLVFSALAVAQGPLRAPAPAPTGRAPVPAPARGPVRAPAPAPKPSVITAGPIVATGNDASGFIRVQGTSFVDEQCKDFLPTGWNTYVHAALLVLILQLALSASPLPCSQVAESAHPSSNCRS